MNIKLIVSTESNCTHRARWAFQYKGIPHELVDISTLSKEEIYRLSPLGKVPAAVIDERPLAESLAIIEFLEETFPEPPLLPRAPYERAKVREIAEMVNGTIHAVQSSKVGKFFIPTLTQEETAAFRRKWIERHLPLLETLLFKDSAYAAGTAFSLADIFVLPIFVKGLGFGMQANQFPRYVSHVRHCQQNEKVWKACPTDLKETITKLKLY